jgi:RES domain-containing protein
VIRAWRLVDATLAAVAFDGDGARQFGGRWNSPGTAVVYTSSTLSLAVLEILVHLLHPRVLDGYVSIPIEFDDRWVEDVDQRRLPSTWRTFPAPPALQQVGDDWVAAQRSAVLRVPSALVPQESTYVLNPRHRDFSRARLGPSEPFRLDVRL